MARTPDITVRVRPDMRNFDARMARAAYQAWRIGLYFGSGLRAVDTPDIIDARDTAYTLADAAEGPAPWEVAQ